MKKTVCIFLVLVNGVLGYSGNRRFREYTVDFSSGVQQLKILELTYDHREYFSNIPSLEDLQHQEVFFIQQKNSLLEFNPKAMNFADQLIYQHILYEIQFNLHRVSIEKDWVEKGRNIPHGSLFDLEDHTTWYRYFIKKFTSLDLEPEIIMEFGKKEVERVQDEISSIRDKLGFNTDEDFYLHLQSNQFQLTDKKIIQGEFFKTDSIIRSNLPQFIGQLKVYSIYPLEWPEAGPYTPPGIYLNQRENAYGKDVFLYNFYGQKYNSRCIDWIFMHEGIPGHHLQACYRLQMKTDSIQPLFTYPGNFEGWACYVEYEGKNLGVYKDLYRELGKWEWDLIRSTRIVMEVGIHYYGWSKQAALDYWKSNIKGQDEIAEREITRITNWPGQALAYKVGAFTIMELKKETKERYGPEFNEVKFNRCYLSFGMRPLEIIRSNFAEQYAQL